MNEGYQRTPVVIWSEESTGRTAETYGFSGSQGTVLEGQLLRGSSSSSTLYVFMHPTSTLHLLPLPQAMAAQGMHILCAASRYPKNDAALIVEKVVLDLGAWIRWAKEELGYSSIVLMGWSGGGSLALLYQAEAQQPTITASPAGDPISLVDADLVPAEGLVLVAAHLSRAETLTEWMDPSICDESNPDARDLELDIYAKDPVHRPPYDPDFVARFRAAQQARNHRITEWVREELRSFEQSGEPWMERPFIVHRTMCDVRWLDPAIDPNDRKPQWCYLGDPRVVNVGPVGLARFATLRSWLSQWSLQSSNALGARAAARICDIPVLQVENSADDAVPATHHSTIIKALGVKHKEYHNIDGATHYFKGQPEQLDECVAIVGDWSRRHGLNR